MNRLEQHAFHGDQHLIALCRHLIAQSQSFVETGAAAGRTTCFVAREFPDVEVHACEVNRARLAEADNRCAGLPNVHLSREPSPHFLVSLTSARPKLASGFTTFWLDAHWDQDWPLGRELAHVAEHFHRAFIIVDDCRIPGRPEFGFDSYDGKDCGVPLISRCLGGRPHQLVLPKYRKDALVLNQLRGTCTAVLGFDSDFGLPHELLRDFEVILPPEASSVSQDPSTIMAFQ